MKVYAISDFHLSINNPKPMDIFGEQWEDYLDKIIIDWNDRVQDDDIVLISGDISWAMRLNEAIPDLEFISNLKGNKVIIKGNHDYWWNSIGEIRSNLTNKTYALQNDAIKIGNYIFCGNRGWLIPEGKLNTDENNKIYAREVIRLELSLKAAKKLQTDNEEIVFITHYPPFNNKIEQSDYTRMLEEYGVSKVVFGHLHGYVKCDLITEKNGVKYFFTSCDHINNDPVLIYEQ
jgi:predicted phosphohydrolase